MNLLAVSEHYFPRVGGTVNYVHETLSALCALGVNVELLVPGPMPEDWLPAGMVTPPYRVRWVDAGYPMQGDPTRDQRYDFCRKVDALALGTATGPERPDILHVLFGLFVMELLNTERLRAVGLPCVATVHNVPPMECRLVPDSAPLAARIIEKTRLKVVALKNEARLKRHYFDLYVVPSDQVHELLAPIVAAPMAVIGHGTTGALQALMKPPATRCPEPGAPVRFLTVGGYAPHKRQAIIPKVADRLRSVGLKFEWDVVGPASRIAGYHHDVVTAVERAGLTSVVRARTALPLAELATLYDDAHLYVQPSVEEGFCITALDAAAAGLPVIASPAGALACIAELSGGKLVDSEPGPLAQAITDFVLEDRWVAADAQAQVVNDRFSWVSAARALIDRYRSLFGQKEQDNA